MQEVSFKKEGVFSIRVAFWCKKNGFKELDQMKNEYKQWVDDAINNNGYTRGPSWTEGIAVGNRQFVENTKVKLG